MRPTVGRIIETDTRRGVMFAARFQFNGTRHFVSFGASSEGWDRRRAEASLRHLLADVERGNWRPPRREPVPDLDRDPDFHTFASGWFVSREGEWRLKTAKDYRWQLSEHLLPFFRHHRLSQISVAEVDRFKAAELKEGRLSASSINKSIGLLAQVLDAAVDRELIARNVARGRGRKVREHAPARSYLSTAGQIEELLGAAGTLDSEAREDRRHVERRAMLAMLAFAGLRIGELCALRWRDVDLAGGWLVVGESKTDAGKRRVKVRGALRDELLRMRAKLDGVDQDAHVFGTRTGQRPSGDNIRSRVLNAAVERANEDLAKRDLPPLPDKLTPHSLRRTFCSLLYALGETPPVVMQEMGHTDPALALKVYAQAMRCGENEQHQLRELVEGGIVAGSGSNELSADDQAPIQGNGHDSETLQ